MFIFRRAKHIALLNRKLDRLGVDPRLLPPRLKKELLRLAEDAARLPVPRAGRSDEEVLTVRLWEVAQTAAYIFDPVRHASVKGSLSENLVGTITKLLDDYGAEPRRLAATG